MNIEIWCKSFLSIYNLLPILVNSIDKLVYIKSISSSGYSSNVFQDSYTQVENLASLTQKKVNLINLKILCDEVLLQMNKQNSKLIILRYIDELPTEEVIKLLNLSRRTYFRKLAKALKDFELRFYSKVLKNKVLYNNFTSDEFFDDIFEKINTFQNKMKEDNITQKNISNNLFNIILKKMKKAF